MSNVSPKVATFLMFTGQAEEAMDLYTSLFKDSRILSITRYGANQGSKEGTVMEATFSLSGQVFMAIDSPPMHAFTFTPSISLWVNCDSEDEVDRVFARLAEGGIELMPLQEYPFSKRYGWVQDRYGVSWQLTVPR